MRLSCSPFVSSPVLIRVQKQPWRWCLQPGRIHRLELQASLPLPQAQSSAALPSGIYKAKEAVRSQCSAPENLNVSLKETLSQELGIHQYEVTRLPWAPLDTILHKHLESFASDLLSWPSVIWWTHLGRKKAFVFRLRCWILLPVLHSYLLFVERARCGMQGRCCTGIELWGQRAWVHHTAAWMSSGYLWRDLCSHRGIFINNSWVWFQEFALWPFSISLIKPPIVRRTFYFAVLPHPESNVLEVTALLSPSGNSGTAPALWKCGERTWFLQGIILDAKWWTKRALAFFTEYTSSK